ncbi:hypothetical protein Esti_003439 [Eimeria stiedai]
MSEQRERPKAQKAARSVSLNLKPEAAGPPSRTKSSEAAKLLQQKGNHILKRSSSSSSSSGKGRSINGNTSGSHSSIGSKKSSSSKRGKAENSQGLNSSNSSSSSKNNSSSNSSSSSNGSERRDTGSKYDGIYSSSGSSSRLVGRALRKSSSSSSSCSNSSELSVSLPPRPKASLPGQLDRSVGFAEPSLRAAAGAALRRLPTEATSLLTSSSNSKSISSSRSPSGGRGALSQFVEKARLKERSRECQLHMRRASQATEAVRCEVDKQAQETDALSKALQAELGSLGRGLFLETNKILKELVAPDWQIPDTDSLVELMSLRPPELQNSPSGGVSQLSKFPFLTPGSPVAPRRTSLSLPPSQALKREGYWEGPSAQEVFGDRIITPGSPYTLLGVIAVRAKEAVVSPSLGGEPQGTAANCLLSAAAACLPPGPPPPRGLLARPVVPGLLDVCCCTSPPAVYRPPLYAAKQPPAGYPMSPVEVPNVRIVSELEDFLQETVRVAVTRPPWDSRASPVDLPNPAAYYHQRRMQQVLSQQHDQQQQQQQRRQQQGEWSCLNPLECIKSLQHEVVSVHRALQHAASLARKTLWRPAVSLLSSRERKTIKDFWRLRREGYSFLWDFEGLHIQDLDDFATEVSLEVPPLTAEEVQQQEQQAARRQPDKCLLAVLQQLNQLTGRSPSML